MRIAHRNLAVAPAALYEDHFEGLSVVVEDEVEATTGIVSPAYIFRGIFAFCLCIDPARPERHQVDLLSQGRNYGDC